MSGIPSWAVRGQKVTCIKVGGWQQVFGWEDERPSNHPVLNGIYTIAMVSPDPEGRAMLSFDECHPEDFYWIERFRPVLPKATEAEDLAHFRHHLDQRQPERV